MGILELAMLLLEAGTNHSAIIRGSRALEIVRRSFQRLQNGHTAALDVSNSTVSQGEAKIGTVPQKSTIGGLPSLAIDNEEYTTHRRSTFKK